ncbi:glycine cleavage system aminomethyltransferase GcvT, partial [Leucobacter sp. M11]|uniref:glycine cleavage system aminomethyltransferase GcvT n=1 Tax=Leucobacter sp. M11 TaxID=2993565 RepID=UPI002D7F568E
MTERVSPLHAVHEAAGATFTDFAGWQMPVRYASDLDEHHAVRRSAGIFDISHMAEIRVSGTEAAAMLDYALCGRLSATTIGQAKYSMLLSERGTVLDDLVVYRLAEDAFLVVANAGNHDVVLAELTARAEGFAVDVADESAETALIAVQGPRAVEVLSTLAELEPETPFAELGYYRATPASYAGTPVLIARTGYTGEDGVEVYLPGAEAVSFWTAILAAGDALGAGTVVPAGLAARDTLRLEAGMPLYGHELSAEIVPAQLGMAKIVVLGKAGDFVGRAATEAGEHPDRRILVGLRAEGRRAARAGAALFAPGDPENAEPIGVVTSGV